MLAASYFFYGYWNWRFVLPARAVDRRQPGCSRGRSTASATTSAPRAPRRRRPRQPRHPRLLQVLRLLRQSSRRLLDELGIDTRPRSLNDHAAGRHLVLHVPGAELRDRRLPPRASSPAPLLDFAVYLSFFPHLVAGPIVRGGEFLPQLRSATTRAASTPASALFLIAIGLFKKVVIANFLATEIVDRVFASPGQHSSLEVLVGVYALRAPDLRRLQRLHRHRHRPRAAARLPVPAELRRPVHGDVAAGLLAPLAHDAVAVAARLPLHPARRQPRRATARRTATSCSRWCSAASGTAPRGRSSSGARSTAACSRSSTGAAACERRRGLARPARHASADARSRGSSPSTSCAWRGCSSGPSRSTEPCSTSAT